LPLRAPRIRKRSVNQMPSLDFRALPVSKRSTDH
jgi:hypothetical protein